MTKLTVKIGESEVDLSLNSGRVMYGAQNGQDLGDLENGPLMKMFINPVICSKAIWANYGDRITDSGGIQNEQDFHDAFGADLKRNFERALKEAIADFFTWGPAVVEKIEQTLEEMQETLKNFKASGQASGDSPE